MRMEKDRKARAQHLANELQRSTGYDADNAKELVALHFEEAKDSLLTARGDDIFRAQGEAQALSKLLVAITRPAPKMQRKMQEQ